MELEETSDSHPQADAVSARYAREGDAEQRAFQFSLRAMFILMTLLAVAFSVLLAAPPLVRIIGAAVFTLALPAVLTVVLIYDRGYARTFCIGALFPAGVMLWPFGSTVPMFMYGMGGGGLNDVGYVPAIFVAVGFAASMVFGLIAIGVRWIVESRQQEQCEETSAISP